MANRIVLNTVSYHGKGAIGNIVPELTARGFQKAFVCSDPDLIRFNVTKKVTDLLDAAGFAYEVYSDIKPNPTIENVQTGVAAFRKSGADCIVAIGGGSSMDTAKAIGVIIENPEFADVRSLEGVAPTKKHAVFTIAVPTTAGTAAEVTINYVITDVEKKRKFVCVDTNDGICAALWKTQPRAARAWRWRSMWRAWASPMWAWASYTAWRTVWVRCMIRLTVLPTRSSCRSSWNTTRRTRVKNTGRSPAPWGWKAWTQ